VLSNRHRVRLDRKIKGSAIAEFGPALGLILIFFFFPLIDLLAVGLSYGFVMVLNYNQVHEASLLPASQASSPTGTVIQGIPAQWLNGMGRFVKMQGSPVTAVTYRDGQLGADQVTDKIVTVTTTVICTPFFSIPLPCVNVPGINAPMTFSVLSERPMENPDDSNQ
jgi:hypothetical protein